ncbi:MAG: hypothetical protein O4804_04900 [Trichodesmium sp. St11_bin5]|nr:hypothetical protein [Trichodesmium sp. St11_bin5]
MAIATTNGLRKTKTELFRQKKRLSRKYLAAVEQNKQVLLLSKAREGKLHNLKLLDQEKSIGNIPVEIPIEVMSGFQGINISIKISAYPIKNKKGEN